METVFVQVDSNHKFFFGARMKGNWSNFKDCAGDMNDNHSFEDMKAFQRDAVEHRWDFVRQAAAEKAAAVRNWNMREV